MTRLSPNNAAADYDPRTDDLLHNHLPPLDSDEMTRLALALLDQAGHGVTTQRAVARLVNALCF